MDDFTCYAGRALAQVERARADDAEKRDLPAGWNDGKHLYVRPHDPERDKPLKPPKMPTTGGRE